MVEETAKGRNHLNFFLLISFHSSPAVALTLVGWNPWEAQKRQKGHMAYKVKFHLKTKNQNKTKKTSPGPLDSLLKYFPLHPTHSPRPTHTTSHPTPELLVEPEEHWKFGGRARNPARPQAVGSAATSTVLEMYYPQNTHPLKERQREEARNFRSNCDWHQGSPTLLLGSSLGYERGCKNILTLCPNFQLNQKLDIQGKSQECGRPGVGTLLPQFPSWPTSRIQATQVCLLDRNILRFCLKRKSSVPDFEQ